jgi:hypothetical protein
MGNSNGELKLKKKNWKDGYPKLTLFKISVPNYKSNKRSEIISEVFFFLINLRWDTIGTLRRKYPLTPWMSRNVGQIDRHE